MNIHPRLAGGIYALALFSIAMLLEIVTNFPLASKYGKYVGAVIVGSMVIHTLMFPSKYDPEEGTDPRAYIIFVILSLLFLMIIAFLIR